MSTSHSKYTKMSCAALAFFFTIILLLCSCGENNGAAKKEQTNNAAQEEVKEEAKYTFTDDGVMQAADGTTYHRYEKDVYSCSAITLGDFLGSVEGYSGTDGKKHKKGIYSLNSDGSDDYVVFVEEEPVDSYASGEPQRGLWPIYVKDGCELSFCDWDNLTEVTLMYAAPGTPADENGITPFTTYYLKDDSNPSDAMKALIGDEYADDGKSDYSKYFGDIHYRIKGINLIDITCHTEYKLKNGWIMSVPDSSDYHIKPEAFGAFEMSAEMLDYMQFPLTEDEMIGRLG